MAELQKLDFRGIALLCRRDTTDIDICSEVVMGDFYFLNDLARNDETVRSVVDIGAHIGSFTSLVKAKWPNATVVAYEVDDENFSLFQENTATLSEIYSYNAAVVGTRKRSLKYAAASDSCEIRHTGGGTVQTTSGAPLREWYTLAHPISLLGEIDLLKLDCEGTEADILEHAHANDLLKSVRRIRGEYHGGRLAIERISEALRDSHVPPRLSASR
jgi:FkbM family methyltransferase